jgi:Rrf2 family protein
LLLWRSDSSRVAFRLRSSASELRDRSKSHEVLTGGGIRNIDCYVKRNSRFSIALHALVQMAERNGTPATSEKLAACLLTNPVVVRRTMAGLRAVGLVRSAPGHGGGWILMRAPEAITLAEVYAALGESMLSGAGKAESPGCLVEQAISGLMDDFRRQAEALLVKGLGEKTLSDVAAKVKRLMKKQKPPSVHAA